MAAGLQDCSRGVDQKKIEYQGNRAELTTEGLAGRQRIGV